MPTDEAEHEPIRVRMADGSVYTLGGEHRLRAFHAKYGAADRETVLDAFRESVARHWEDRTKPWKGITVDWGEDPTLAPTSRLRTTPSWPNRCCTRPSGRRSWRS